MKKLTAEETLISIMRINPRYFNERVSLRADTAIEAMHQFAAQEAADNNRKLLQYIDICLDEEHTKGFILALMAIESYIKKQSLPTPPQP